MRSERSRLGRWTPCLAALALAALAGGGRFALAASAKAAIADWPAPSRLTAAALMEKYGPPRETSPDALTWYGTGPWKKTVVRREAEKGDIIEQTVAYRVPPEKAERMRAFDDRVAVDEKTHELTVRSGAESENFLLANLADEVAAGFKTPDRARRFYARQRDLALAGKSSTYLDRLRFQTAPVTAAPGTPAAAPWNARSPWVVPPGTNLPAGWTTPPSP